MEDAINGREDEGGKEKGRKAKKGRDGKAGISHDVRPLVGAASEFARDRYKETD